MELEDIWIELCREVRDVHDFDAPGPTPRHREVDLVTTLDRQESLEGQGKAEDWKRAD